MASEEQLVANRENAKLGGVKTLEGKAVSSKNAIRHGILSNEALLPEEDSEELSYLTQGLMGDLKPQGTLEILLVERIVSSFWRLKRAIRIEAELIENGSLTSQVLASFGREKALGRAFLEDANSDPYTRFTRYETSIERSLYRALHELQRIQALRVGDPVSAPTILDVDIGVSENGFVS